MTLPAESGGDWTRMSHAGVGNLIEPRLLWLLDRETAIVRALLS